VLLEVGQVWVNTESEGGQLWLLTELKRRENNKVRVTFKPYGLGEGHSRTFAESTFRSSYSFLKVLDQAFATREQQGKA